MDALAIIFSLASSIVSGTVLFFLKKKYFEKKEKVDDEKSKASFKESVLILKLIDAIGKLTYAEAIAIRDGKNQR